MTTIAKSTIKLAAEQIISVTSPTTWHKLTTDAAYRVAWVNKSAAKSPKSGAAAGQMIALAVLSYEGVINAQHSDFTAALYEQLLERVTVNGSEACPLTEGQVADYLAQENISASAYERFPAPRRAAPAPTVETLTIALEEALALLETAKEERRIAQATLGGTRTPFFKAAADVRLAAEEADYATYFALEKAKSHVATRHHALCKAKQAIADAAEKDLGEGVTGIPAGIGGSQYYENWADFNHAIATGDYLTALQAALRNIAIIRARDSDDGYWLSQWDEAGRRHEEAKH